MCLGSHSGEGRQKWGRSFYLRDDREYRREQVSIIVRPLALHNADKALEAHPCVDMTTRQLD